MVFGEFKPWISSLLVKYSLFDLLLHHGEVTQAYEVFTHDSITAETATLP
jgi:hypothetical protein